MVGSYANRNWVITPDVTKLMDYVIPTVVCGIHTLYNVLGKRGSTVRHRTVGKANKPHYTSYNLPTCLPYPPALPSTVQCIVQG